MSLRAAQLGEQMLWTCIPEHATGNELADLVHRSITLRPEVVASRTVRNRVSILALSLSGSEGLSFVTVIGDEGESVIPAVAQATIHPTARAVEQNFEARHLGPMRREVGRTSHTSWVTYRSIGDGRDGLLVKFRVAEPSFDFKLLKDSEALMHDLLLRQEEARS